MRVSKATVNRTAREAKGQEEESEKNFMDTGEVKGMDHGASRKGKWSKVTESQGGISRDHFKHAFLGIWASLHRLRSMLREFALIALSRGNDGKCNESL